MHAFRVADGDDLRRFRLIRARSWRSFSARVRSIFQFSGVRGKIETYESMVGGILRVEGNVLPASRAGD
ncbi:MAG: hypothetical protein DLM52_13040 [Chthoniobacterales bacterium]|nr:MAG: hypothetical protein DLM52_13040 [Chthoniobacterales bacterium]